MSAPYVLVDGCHDDDDDDTFLSLFSASTKSVQRRRTAALGAMLLIFGAVGVNLSQSKSLLARHTSTMYLRDVATIATEGDIQSDDDPTTLPQAALDNICRVQFVIDGPTFVPRAFPYLPSWFRHTNTSCDVDFVRSNSTFLTQLTLAERAMFDDTAYITILQADFLKLMIVYYRGGLVADLDVEPLQRFPDQWIGATTTLATCDVVLGVEHACFSDGCVHWYSRKGQIQNWAMYSRRRRSPFFRDLIDYVVAHYATMPRHDLNVPIQDVAGSGAITDFVNLYGDFGPRQHYQVETDSGRTLETDQTAVLRIQKQGEQVCILGNKWTGGGCSGSPACLLNHHFEGSWKH
ncbi:Aste57867_12684 [Aphanomyces stellatus]|uniref:Aste57867_12684 protein n=1 Tax=Aphanomyces stellatus TaxID=120398 RepID=A0A485KY83_9STRA|nr:hypothetical protein As57867_012637 [Aphanomyces stellatus]VFT89534.1 Aste57867_12684 [Aphanomyces stellatus]